MLAAAKWNKTDLKGFYPKGVKDELGYYSTQFNCIELNATFYRLFPTGTFEKWYDTVPEGFRFFPKLVAVHLALSAAKEVEEIVDHNVTNMSHLKEKLGMPFLQMHNNFGPKDMGRVAAFAENWKNTDTAGDGVSSYGLVQRQGRFNREVDDSAETRSPMSSSTPPAAAT